MDINEILTRKWADHKTSVNDQTKKQTTYKNTNKGEYIKVR